MTKTLTAWLLEPLYRRLWRYAVRSGIVLACSDAPDTSGINAAAVQSAQLGRPEPAPGGSSSLFAATSTRVGLNKRKAFVRELPIAAALRWSGSARRTGVRPLGVEDVWQRRAPPTRRIGYAPCPNGYPASL